MKSCLCLSLILIPVFVVDVIAGLFERAFEGIAFLVLAAHAIVDRVLAWPETTGGRAEILVDRPVTVVVNAVAYLGSYQIV